MIINNLIVESGREIYEKNISWSASSAQTITGLPFTPTGFVLIKTVKNTQGMGLLAYINGTTYLQVIGASAYYISEYATISGNSISLTSGIGSIYNGTYKLIAWS